jgi:predicted nucleotidyltransferase
MKCNTMKKETEYLSQNERMALDEIKRRVSAQFTVGEFILFGSKARGDFGPDSDIDLLVVAARSLTWRENDDIIGIAYEINLAYSVLFTVHTVAEQDWNNGLWTGLSLRQNIEQEGVRV